MSKSQLKKELATLDHGQLVQLILDLYSARKDAKEYFEFFLNPDVDSLFEKYCNVIDKEMNRSKYGECMARISKIRAAIKDFASFDVGSEAVLKLMLYALCKGLVYERVRYFSKTLINGFAKIAEDILVFGDRHEIFDLCHNSLSAALDGSIGSKIYVNYIRKYLDWSALR